MTLDNIVTETDWPAVNYAKWILEMELSLAAMHGRYYVELLTDTITAVSKSRRWSVHQAYKHLVRAVRLAKEQGIPVEMPVFFRDGLFDQMRPKAGTPYGPVCEPECRARHGRGYHANDMMWLWKKYVAHVKGGGRQKPEDFLGELDSKRQGGPPEWRVNECRNRPTPVLPLTE